MPDSFTTGDHCAIAWTADGERDAPALILSNSLGADMHMWEPQVPALAKHFCVVRYDTRGHGGSDVPPGAYSLDRLGRDVLELADFLGLERFAFCGLSLGGMTGQWLGCHAPERLERLVIANSSPYMGPPTNWQARIDLVQEKGMPAVAEAVVERWFTPEFREDPTRTAATLETLLATRPEGYAGCSGAIRDMDMRPLLGLIQVPTLVIGGTRDPATPLEHTDLLRNGIPAAQCRLINAAHLSNIECAEEFTQHLLAFLNQ